MKAIDPRELRNQAKKARAQHEAKEKVAKAAIAARGKREFKKHERDARKILAQMLPHIETCVREMAGQGFGGVAIRLLYTVSRTCMFTPPASIAAFDSADQVLVEVLSRRMKRNSLRSLNPEIGFNRNDPGRNNLDEYYNNLDEYYGGSAWCTLTLTWDPDAASKENPGIDMAQYVSELRESLPEPKVKRRQAA